MEPIFGTHQLNADTWGQCDDLAVIAKYLADPNRSTLHPSIRKIRLVMAAAMYPLRTWIVDPRSWQTVEASERFADHPDPDVAILRRAHDIAWPVYEELNVEGAAWFDPADSPRHVKAILARIFADLLGEHLVNGSECPYWLDFLEDIVACHTPERTAEAAKEFHARLFHDIFPNPFRPVAFAPGWVTPTVTALAAAIYADRAWDRMPVLADALEEAGCADARVLSHCRDYPVHARGCWVVDAILGKS